MTELPDAIQTIRDDFREMEERNRLQLLLEFANGLPELPERYRKHPELFERVVECQSPVFIFVEVDERQQVQVFATAPLEAPTTRGFASILVQGLSGLSVQDVLGLDTDFPLGLGLTKVVSPLRIRGMVAMLGRIKRQVQEKAAV